MRLNPLAYLKRLLSTFWFLPSVVTASAAAAAELIVWIDRAYPESGSWLGWAYGGGADGARSLLSAIAGSTITVVSVTFSVLVVALTVSSQHFGPRLLTNFMRDTPAQLVLGTFTGTFAYCLMALRTVQGDGDQLTYFVPHLAVTGAVLLTLFSIAVLIYYVHHVAVSMQVSEITSRVAADLEQAIARLYPDPLGDSPEPTPEDIPDVPPDAIRIDAPTSGYIQGIEGRVIEVAGEYRTTIWLIRRPGDFVIEGSALAVAHPAEAEREKLTKALQAQYVIGSDRTSEQDAAFAVQQLVEVALRALSPGVNETFTACTCIDRLGQGLSPILTRRLPNTVRVDESRRGRVIAMPRTFEELAVAAFEPIAINAGRTPNVSMRLLGTLEQLARLARRREDRETIGRLADVVATTAAEQVPPGHRPALASRCERIHWLLATAVKTTGPS
jgi:uncharacterized membrane protein